MVDLMYPAYHCNLYVYEVPVDPDFTVRPWIIVIPSVPPISDIHIYPLQEPQEPPGDSAVIGLARTYGSSALCIHGELTNPRPVIFGFFRKYPPSPCGRDAPPPDRTEAFNFNVFPRLPPSHRLAFQLFVLDPMGKSRRMWSDALRLFDLRGSEHHKHHDELAITEAGWEHRVGNYSLTERTSELTASCYSAMPPQRPIASHNVLLDIQPLLEPTLLSPCIITISSVKLGDLKPSPAALRQAIPITPALD
ncbi:hypothetical protein SODALDRAFT_361250 [Sodiomyces alkalinus F11]|uniref:Uncharacterized protein n=1 Tax=Sodiomyces alkalinus (strain CBS 110278 / VKM F-3762 / F11) TaxID=1314773 RepID=A0A3N2PTA0_SODAK|nr:hypothetical protein SODALDRAFT_361250 [Sodiomyces alkalinus F11]ROT37536.1 hypothetical protein SODALDRAFT_361250 [Sodiomyces alkalinus F11]